MAALGRKPTAAGRGSSNPQPHQKTMLFELSKLFVQLLLPRQIPEPSLMLGFFMRQCFELCTKCEAEGGSLLLIGFDPDSPMMFLND